VDHHTAPVDLRERLSVERDELPKTLQQLSEYAPQSAILSTCNRTEVYVYDPYGQGLEERVGDFISEHSGAPRPELERHTYKRKWRKNWVAFQCLLFQCLFRI
jgi:glutamyl-tRNA reductase